MLQTQNEIFLDSIIQPRQGKVTNPCPYPKTKNKFNLNDFMNIETLNCELVTDNDFNDFEPLDNSKIAIELEVELAEEPKPLSKLFKSRQAWNIYCKKLTILTNIRREIKDKVNEIRETRLNRFRGTEDAYIPEDGTNLVNLMLAVEQQPA